MIASNAEVDPSARIADSAVVWGLAQVRENATLGENCIVGRGAYIDAGVHIGDNCKIQNNALIYSPARIGDGVFIGPAAVFTNDRFPRAVTPEGDLKSADDWESEGVVVRKGAAIGARAVILGGVEVGEWSLVAAGSVVTNDVPDYALVAGAPARRVGWVGPSGRQLERDGDELVDVPTGVRFVEFEHGVRVK